MRKTLPLLLCIALFGAVPAFAGGLDLNLNLHLGTRGPATTIVSEAPLFLESATLGLQVAVGTPYPMFHVDGRYFIFRQGRWLVGPGYRGPWDGIRHDRLPPGLARRSSRQVIAVRDEECERYRHGRYHGRTFRPGKEEHARREHRHWQHERWEHGRGKKHWHEDRD